MITGEKINKYLSPQDLRKILNADNLEIVQLCRKASIVPHKDKDGKTYFSMEEARLLKQAKEKKPPMSKSSSQVVVNTLLSSLKKMETDITSSVTESVTKVLDERLEGMDEVVVELIRCKTENENLKNKVNELNKENYKLKNTLNSYKPFAFGLYMKKQEDDILL